MAGKREVKEQAQDAIMHALANGVLGSRESNESDEKIQEMLNQASRVGKMFGYKNWPGLGDFA
jgi:cytosine/adenosine deaminase-related metal-dependent hydrolase